MPLPNFNLNPYIQPYVGAGVSQAFGESIDQRIHNYEAALEHEDVLGYQTDNLINSTAPFEGDQEYAKVLMHDTRKLIEERAGRGDYENMQREIRRSARNFATKAQPILENQKRYADYTTKMQDLYQTGKISVDTYSKAKQAALGSYRGIDPSNVQSSMFQGFIPSPDINVAEKVDKFLSGWKENGGTKLIPDGQGGYMKVDWSNAREEDIAKAAQEYLQGDSEFTGYFQTQNAIGNNPRVLSELEGAIKAGAEKYGFYKEDRSLFWEPEWINNNKNILDFSRNLTSTPSSATTNPNAVDIFDGQGFNFDTKTGKIMMGNSVRRIGDKYFKYTDKDGSPLSLEKVDELSKGVGFTKVGNVPYNAVEVSAEEAAKQTQEANKMLVDMASQRFLNEAIKNGTIGEDVLNNQQAINDYLRINTKRFSSPEYLKTTKEQYSEAVKNVQQIYDNTRWEISTIPGAATPEFTTLKDDDILANLTGQSIGILDTEIGGFRKGQRADINSLTDKLTDDGYKIKAVRRLGPLKYNPYSNLPGMSYSVITEDADGKTKTIELAASIQDKELQALQDVNNLFYKGLSGDVPFTAPKTVIGQPISGTFRVRTTTDLDPRDGKRKPVSFIEVLDTKGNKLNVPGFPQNIPMNQFADIYKDIFAPELVVKYINPKYTKK